MSGDAKTARAALVAPALLFLTALVQVALVQAGSLTPWKGGGFGLFSSVDKLEDRVLLAWAVGPAGAERALPAPPRDQALQDALSLPSARHLRRVAVRLLAGETGAPAVRVEVWRRTFDRARGECRRVRVAELTVPRAR